jgi:SNF2 family DNA or RNA helicase
VILSGNPVPKSPAEIFSQFKFIEPGVFGSNYTKFSDYFFDQDYFKKVTGFKSGKELEYTEKFHSISLRKTKSECLSLPKKVYMKEWVDLTGEQHRVYKEMREEAVASLEDSTITAPVVITKILRLSQISGGIFPREDGSIKYFNPNPKLARLLELIEELPKDEQITIWARFQGEIELISIALSEAGISNAKYYGKTPVDQRNVIATEFEARRIRVFIGNPATGGRGINFLRHCTTVIYYSLDFSSENRQQSEDRNNRSGTVGERTLYIDILSKDTIDPLILNVLQQNKDFSDAILNRNIKI